MSIVVEHISKNFITGSHRIVALDNINIEFDKGEFVCIVGPSGCGKSTLLNIIAVLKPARAE